jgi:cell wall-associated NlpC family hydrolase
MIPEIRTMNLARLLALTTLIAPLALVPAEAQSRTSSKVLGRLGQTVSSASIYASKSTRSRVYFKVKAYEYLIVRSPQGNWTPVVMENGSLGYLPNTKVAVLPYNVTTGGLSGGTKNSSGGRVTAPTPSRGQSGSKARTAERALEYIGTPYKWGGNDLNRGIDCSGLVQQLFGEIGIDLPRTAREQALVGQPIKYIQDLQAGDRLYFWDKKRGRIGHTGIYMGNNFFVHSSVNNKGVATDDLRNPKWRAMLVSARR